MYFILGIPQYLLWAFLTTIASFLPIFGTGLIWLPLTIYLLLVGSYIKALILLLYSVLIIAQVDNFLKPLLIGGRTGIHNLLVFFSVLGGLAKFGLFRTFSWSSYLRFSYLNNRNLQNKSSSLNLCPNFLK